MEPMIEAIQRAYYFEAQNPSDDETLIALGDAIGLDRERFVQALTDPCDCAAALRMCDGTSKSPSHPLSRGD